MSPTNTKTIPIARGKLWATRDGPCDALCIILVAGANASHLMWPDEFCELLVAEHYSVIRFDHRDTGKSTRFEFPADPCTLADLSEDIIAVLDGFAISHANVVGMSMDGALVQVAVLNYQSARSGLRSVARASYLPSGSCLPGLLREILGQKVDKDAHLGR